jgi:hypothetical protein
VNLACVSIVQPTLPPSEVTAALEVMRPGRNHHDRAHRLIVHDFGRTQPPTATRRFRRAYAQPTATSRPYDAMMAWAGADGWVGSPHPLVVRRSFRRAYPSAMRVGVSASPTEQVMVRRTLRRGDGRVVRMVRGERRVRVGLWRERYEGPHNGETLLRSLGQNSVGNPRMQRALRWATCARGPLTVTVVICVLVPPLVCGPIIAARARVG